MNILTVNLLFSTVVFWIAAGFYVLPRLDDCEPRAVLLPILLLHSLRYLGGPGVMTSVPCELLYDALTPATRRQARPRLEPFKKRQIQAR